MYSRCRRARRTCKRSSRAASRSARKACSCPSAARSCSTSWTTSTWCAFNIVASFEIRHRHWHSGSPDQTPDARPTNCVYLSCSRSPRRTRSARSRRSNSSANGSTTTSGASPHLTLKSPGVLCFLFWLVFVCTRWLMRSFRQVRPAAANAKGDPRHVSAGFDGPAGMFSRHRYFHRRRRILL